MSVQIILMCTFKLLEILCIVTVRELDGFPVPVCALLAYISYGKAALRANEANSISMQIKKF